MLFHGVLGAADELSAVVLLLGGVLESGGCGRRERDGVLLHRLGNENACPQKKKKKKPKQVLSLKITEKMTVRNCTNVCGLI